MAAAKVLLTLPFQQRYGWDRDELYFLAAARHPALGYVDFPPVSAWIGWTVVHTAGASLLWLRMTGQVASAIGVVLVALIARDLGGGRAAQVASAVAWASTPVALASASIYHPTIYDITVWIAVSWVSLRLLLGGGMRWWIALGLLSGLGIETKYTIAVFLVALVVALAASPQRALLRGRGPLVACALATLLTIPNLIWQAQHDWASVRFYPSQQAKSASDTSHLAYVGDGILFLGAMALVAAIGIAWFWRHDMRPLALAPPIAICVFFAGSGRAYYPLPALALPVAAGVVAAATWVSSRRRKAALAGVAALHLALLAVVVPVVVPVLSTASMIHDGIWNQTFYKDEIGWPEMRAQALRAWAQVPASDRANAVVLAGNYGEAGALAYFGARGGLPPVVSGHLSWQYWGPQPRTQTVALTVGYDRAEVRGICAGWQPLVRIQNRWHIANEEQGRWIGWCRLVRPLGQLWQSRIATDTL